MELNRLLERVKAIAQSGLTYSEGPYDRDRYNQLAQTAEALAALLTRTPVDDVRKHWVAETGYATPKVDVRAAVFRDNKVLLCKETMDGCWSLPGGWADVGESPAGNAVKECWEESGFRVRATKLIACFDRDLQGHPHSMTHTYKLFYLCSIESGEARVSMETSAVDFFAPGALPELSLPRVTPAQIDMCFRHHADPNLPTQFE